MPVEDASVEFYNGETLIDTVDTDEDGLAVCTVSDLSLGSYNFSCVCNGVYSDMVSVSVGSSNVMELTVTGSSFSTYSPSPFTYTGRVFVDWGDDTLVEYTGGKLSHSFTDGLNSHMVKVYGNITSLRYNCFDSRTGLTNIELPDSITSLMDSALCYCTGLTSIEIPNNVTSLGGACFYGCTGLTSIEIPNNVTSLGSSCFERCTGLTLIGLNWTGNNILTYKSSWISNTSSSLKFSIPNGTTSLYTAKGYPSNRLVEDSS